MSPLVRGYLNHRENSLCRPAVGHAPGPKRESEVRLDLWASCIESQSRRKADLSVMLGAPAKQGLISSAWMTGTLTNLLVYIASGGVP